jgi:hypothetical protein
MMANQATIRKSVTLPLHSVQMAEHLAAENGQSVSAFISWMISDYADKMRTNDKEMTQEEVYAKAANMSDEEAYEYVSSKFPDCHIMASKERQLKFKQWMEEQLNAN